MSETVTSTDRSLVRRVASNAAVAVVFGLFFAYDVWQAIGNFIGIVSNANQLQVAVAAWGWVVLIGAVALPALLWMLAIVLGWRRPLLQKIAIQLLALTVSSVTFLSIVTMFNDSNLYILGS